MLKGRKSKIVPARVVWLLVSGLIPLVLLTGCLVPVTTPTPLPPPVTVDLSSKTDSQGVLLETVRITSSDGRLTSTLPKGSRLLDGKGRPVKSLTLTPYRPPESSDGVVVGLAYKWDDVALWGSVDPTGNVTISYDPPPANSRINANKPDIAAWWDEKNLWAMRTRPATADPATHTISGPQVRFHPYVVIYWYADVTPPLIVPPPTPTPQAG
jgi:hypothetical protein